VAVGIRFAVKLSYLEGYISNLDYEKIVGHFNDIGLKNTLPKKLKNINAKKFVSEMLKDKKTVNKSLNLILIKRIGSAFIKKNYSQNKLIELYKEITN
jgi:3-dehydroquinate synthetase